jgi:hypothetical protein
MEILGNVAAAIHRHFSEVAPSLVTADKVIQRRRIFTASSLLQTFVMGFLKKPDASDEDLAQVAALVGAPVTPQAIEQRFTPQLADFLQEVFQKIARTSIESDQSLAPLLDRFTKVEIRDGSTITLPDSMKEKFAGCGGSYDSGKAAMKLQTAFDLRGGKVTVELEQGRSPDAATPRQHERLGKGSLTIKDLGFFDLDVMEEQDRHGEYFLSRLQFGTKVFLDGEDLGGNKDVMSWLAKQSGPFVDREVAIGKNKRLKVRLIAWRVPPDVANERRRKLRQETKKRKGVEPSSDRLEWCDWTILVTNVPLELMTPQEAVILYGARWQVELLFKRWKSLNMVAVLSGSTEVRQMVRVWSRLIASIIQHWLTLATVWGNPRKSLTKANRAIQEWTALLMSALHDPTLLAAAIATLKGILGKTVRRDNRCDAGTFELLNDSSLLDLNLT